MRRPWIDQDAKEALVLECDYETAGLFPENDEAFLHVGVRNGWPPLIDVRVFEPPEGYPRLLAATDRGICLSEENWKRLLAILGDLLTDRT